MRDGKLYDLQHVRAGEFSCMIYTPLSQILLGGVSFSLFMFAIVVVLLMCLTVAIIHIVHQINGPMQKLVEICEGMKANDLVEIDDFGMPQELWTLTAAINRMLARVRHLIDENYSIKLEAKNTELQLLRSQINPHYLYNTLEYIHVAAYNKKDYDVSRMAELLGKICSMDCVIPTGQFLFQRSLKNSVNILTWFLIIIRRERSWRSF